MWASGASAPGTYTVTVADAAGNTATSAVTISRRSTRRRPVLSPHRQRRRTCAARWPSRRTRPTPAPACAPRSSRPRRRARERGPTSAPPTPPLRTRRRGTPRPTPTGSTTCGSSPPTTSATPSRRRPSPTYGSTTPRPPDRSPRPPPTRSSTAPASRSRQARPTPAPGSLGAVPDVAPRHEHVDEPRSRRHDVALRRDVEHHHVHRRPVRPARRHHRQVRQHLHLRRRHGRGAERRSDRRRRCNCSTVAAPPARPSRVTGSSSRSHRRSGCRRCAPLERRLHRPKPRRARRRDRHPHRRRARQRHADRDERVVHTALRHHQPRVDGLRDRRHHHVLRIRRSRPVDHRLERHDAHAHHHPGPEARARASSAPSRRARRSTRRTPRSGTASGPPSAAPSQREPSRSSDARGRRPPALRAGAA